MSEHEPKEKFYLTTPIYYVNARPHIGHAYSTIVGDVLARRHRLLGDDTWFLTGTDEHGQKIERSAAAAGVPPQEFADQVSETFRALWKRMGITNDQFIRTTDEPHKRGVQKLFADLHAKGFIYLSTYTGQYSIGEEMFVEGPPGVLGPDGRPTETVTEENFFFKLSEFQRPLLDLIESGGLKITPESSKNEVLSFLAGNVSAAMDEAAGDWMAWGASSEPPDVVLARVGERAESLGLLKRTAGGRPYVPGALKDLSVSRSSFTWGIPVPEPAASEAAQKHVIYVWLDALANYMTAVGYGSDAPEDVAKFAEYWPADVHLVGKEITRFHCVYWPAFLMAAGLPVPKAVTANGWLLFDNAKMSKSKGNVVRTETILEGFGEHVYGKQFPESSKEERDLFGADVLRYFLLREIPFGQDGSFSFEAIVTRYNADLANGYGNLVSRTLSMIEKYEHGVIALEDRNGWSRKEWLDYAFSKSSRLSQWGSLGGSSETGKNSEFGMFRVIEHALRAGDIAGGKYGNVGFQAQLAEIGLTIKMADGFITSETPWKVAKDEESRSWLRDILYTAAESIRLITILLYPVLPYSTTKVWQQLGLDPAELKSTTSSSKVFIWGGLKTGTKIGILAPIFPRADKSLPQIMEDMEVSSANTNTKAHVMTEDTSQVPASNKTHLADPLKGATTPAAAAEVVLDPTHPAAPPRTSSLDAPDAGAAVGGSHAVTTERSGTPGHAEAQASGIFAGAPDTAQIGIEDFVKVDLRVAKILVAERIPKADKLLRLEVDLGYEQRQILSGIAEWYTPEELVGRKIVIIANLAPRKMRGLESRGMLLAASEGENGKPVLATFGEEIAVGTRLR